MGLHAAGPSTWGLRKDPAAPDFSCTPASLSYQPPSCIAVLPAAVHSVLTTSHRNLELLALSCSDKLWPQWRARKRKETLLSKLHARHSRSRRVSHEQLQAHARARASDQRRTRLNANPDSARLVILLGAAHVAACH